MASEAVVDSGGAGFQVRVHITQSSTGLELMDGAEIVFRSRVARRWLPAKSDLCRRWVNEGCAEVMHEGVRHRLPLPSSAERERFTEWEAYWTAIMFVFKNSSRSPASLALARERGVGWSGSLDRTVLAAQGYVTLPELLPSSVREAGHAVMAITRGAMENRPRAVNHPGLGRARVWTSRPLCRALYRALPAADKFSHHPYDEGTAPGTGVAFDGTSPHRAPGVGDGEGSRWIIYIGFQSTKTHLNGLAPVLAHAPDDPKAAHERVWDGHGMFRLESATGRKRPRTVSG
jgi:hypothetical protein